MKGKFINEYKYQLTNHFKQNLIYIVLGIIFLIVGIVVGIILSNSEKSYLGLLGEFDKNSLNYISGASNIMSIFWHHFFVGLSALVIIFIFCLNYFSSYLSLIYIAYQSCVATLAILSSISLYGFSSIITCALYQIPVNLILFAIVIVFYSVCASRSKTSKKENVKFAKSFQNSSVVLMLSCLIVFVVFMILFNIIFPIVFRGIYIINY